MPAHARRTVRVTTAPSLEPVTLAEVKSWAKVDSTDDDALLQELLTAARISAEEYTRRSFISQTLRLTLDLSGSGLDSALGEGVYELPHTELYGGLPRVIELPKPPAVSITSVTTYNTSGTSAAYASTNYYLNTHGNRLALYDTAVWPSPLRALGACEVVYVAGYGNAAADVPAPIRTAIKMHTAKMYDERLLCDLPDGCRMLLGQYRVMDGLSAYG